MACQLTRCFEPCWPPVYPPYDGGVCVPVPVCPSRASKCPCQPITVPQCPFPVLIAPAIGASPPCCPPSKKEPHPGYPHCRKPKC